MRKQRTLTFICCHPTTASTSVTDAACNLITIEEGSYTASAFRVGVWTRSCQIVDLRASRPATQHKNTFLFPKTSSFLHLPPHLQSLVPKPFSIVSWVLLSPHIYFSTASSRILGCAHNASCRLYSLCDIGHAAGVSWSKRYVVPASPPIENPFQYLPSS